MFEAVSRVSLHESSCASLDRQMQERKPQLVILDTSLSRDSTGAPRFYKYLEPGSHREGKLLFIYAD